ncbi:Swi3-domain-containing protein [Sistotremastrum niveocremeum HHB9708]|uniref:Chromosome segregation in meiosis protein n=1 Tax=Sistotremastrum niveocremeum HHB9708 TaxID=1314777 RepID=A0A165ALB0_9AGAM|nr:Swi3-domain-containing protein [Sistotremastrum niveocremeum HHB9708]
MSELDIWSDSEPAVPSTPRTRASSITDDLSLAGEEEEPSKHIHSKNSRLFLSDSEEEVDAPKSKSPGYKVAAPKPSNTRLFLSDSEDEPDVNGEEPQSGATKDTSAIPDEVDALFADIEADDDFALKPSLDLEALRKQASARQAVASSSSIPLPVRSSSPVGDLGKSDNDKPVKPRVVPKLDEDRLLERNGFPALINEAKKFQVTGKGHEREDLDRLLYMYQLWGHKMFPKMQFRDMVERVEKICRKKRMTVALSGFRDAGRPANEYEEDEPEDGEEATEKPPAEARTEDQPESRRSEQGSPSANRQATQATAISREEEESIWADMMDGLEETTTRLSQANASSAPARMVEDEDEDMWDIVREHEAQEQRDAAPEKPSAPPQPLKPSGDAEYAWDDDDDLYVN